MRTRSVAVVIECGELLVIARRKNGREYCVMPGGGVEDGETAREACVRELREETGLHGVVTAELTPPTFSESAVYFQVTAPHQAPSLGGPEAARSDESNSYKPRWVPIAELDHINLVPDHARVAVRRQLERPPRFTGSLSGLGPSRELDGTDPRPAAMTRAGEPASE